MRRCSGCIAEGLIDGVRVDHVDGLADPRGYCRRLRARLDALAAQRPADAPRGPAWLVVEKILGAGERLPDDWAVRRHQRLRLHGRGERAAARRVRRGCACASSGRE